MEGSSDGGVDRRDGRRIPGAPGVVPGDPGARGRGALRWGLESGLPGTARGRPGSGRETTPGRLWWPGASSNSTIRSARPGYGLVEEDWEFWTELTRRPGDRIQILVGGVDILAANAGIAMGRPFLEITPEEWDRMMAVNLKGVFLCGQEAARLMIRQGTGGAIVNMSSTNGLMGERGLAHYNASKAGVMLLSKTMAIELAPHGIRVNSVNPGFIPTELTAESDLDPELTAGYLDKIPLGRFGRTDEVASAFCFLASDDASFVTGTELVVDGGQLAEE